MTTFVAECHRHECRAPFGILFGCGIATTDTRTEHGWLKALTCQPYNSDVATATEKLTFEIPVGPAASREVERRRKRVLSLLVRSAASALEAMPPQTLANLEKRLEQPVPRLSTEDQAFIARITGGKEYSAEESAVLEAAALVRSFQHREELLRDSLSVAQVAKALGVSRQTPHDRARAGTLLGVLDKGAWRFPRWQFDADGPNGVIGGLPEVLEALDVSPLAKVAWLTQPNRSLGSKSPLQMLEAGKVEAVLAEARAVGVM